MIYLMRRAPQAERDVESKNICEGNRLRVITLMRESMEMFIVQVCCELKKAANRVL